MSDSTAPARDPREISWPLEFPLSKPIVVGQNTVQFLSLREPTGEEVLKFGLLEGLSADQFFPLVADLSATPPPVLMKIGARDVLQLGTILSRFFVWAALPPVPSTTASA
ncbi:hypothetical protein ABID82_006953 [Methylobacterium sp. PvP062]|uniref:Tail assembly chaperone E/41/14-like protein n=1 Tax=Methylobacterium radiotolerans TaxID=31998 RepID=A0ABV2NPW4_9HYPH|nr:MULTISPECIES: phage tail assembly protein [unclassified Methylobacterium]MBP2494713.1 hypothetical protein [Methylobacterium sp. PvP105]MBP2505416.1 hypothetical protein [Methylobacterium sp. PvP109]MCX7336137.1 phage tail assembly protein [Hyphomicrobiales bacterium]